MAGHLNHEINRYGRTIATRLLSEHGYIIIVNEPRLMVAEKNGKKYLVNVNTKRPDIRQGELATGKNESDLQSLETKAEELGFDYILMVFCNAQTGVIRAETLAELMKPQTFFGINYPLLEITHSNRIVFFSIYHIKELGDMLFEEQEHLKGLISSNAVDKNQTKLF